ncbi:MAG: hypothetical protein CV087_14305 [Candidatus Brocadia sp. WS118]|nr:MAG: hypothetical protein CV087_14305 [Candidatus Brocadia sp. WS118]
MAIGLPNDFKEFFILLNANGVEYLLIGGYAVGYHGYPRATNDIDIWIAMNQENAGKMMKVLKEFGFDTPELSSELFLQKDRMIRLGMLPMQIEVLVEISGVKFSECYAERINDVIDGIPVNLISLKHLKINKKASGRYKDLDDLEHLP